MSRLTLSFIAAVLLVLTTAGAALAKCPPGSTEEARGRAARTLRQRQLGRGHDLATCSLDHEAEEEPRVGIGFHGIGDLSAGKRSLVFGEMSRSCVEIGDVQRRVPTGRCIPQCVPGERQAGCSASTGTALPPTPVRVVGGAGVPLKAAR